MSGTRKLEKFELELPAAAFQSGTRKLEKFAEPNALSIKTPIAEISPAMLAAARSSSPSLPPMPPGPVVESVVIASDPEPPRVSRTTSRDTGVEQLRTRLARKFTTLADEVTESFADFHIGAGAWVVELTAPDGMSTAGGKRVLQHLRLRPTRQGHAVLVGGVVNAVDKTAELRDYEHMVMIYRARFGQPLEIMAGEWEQFLRKAELVLRQQNGLQTSRVSAPRDLLALASKAAPITWWNRNMAMVALALVGFLASLMIWRVLVVILR